MAGVPSANVGTSETTAAAQGQLLEAAIVLMMLVELGLFLRS